MAADGKIRLCPAHPPRGRYRVTLYFPSLVPASLRALLLLSCAGALGVLLGPPVAADEGRADAKTGAVADGAQEAAQQTWYASTIAQSDDDFMVTHYWSKGRKLRAETVIAGRRIITIVNGPTYYIIDPVLNAGIGIGRAPLALEDDAERTRPFGDEHEAILRGGGERVGERELAGQKVDLYRLTNSAGRVEVWVVPGANLPVRVERYLRESGKRERLNYVNWISGLYIDDSFFEPPRGMEIQTFDYEAYVRRALGGPVGPAPPLYSNLLHGELR